MLSDITGGVWHEGTSAERLVKIRDVILESTAKCDIPRQVASSSQRRRH